MSEFTDKVAALEAVLASSMVFDRFLMDKAFKQLSGLTLSDLDPKFRKKLERVLSGFNHLGQLYPQVADETMPLPATALVSCNIQMETVLAAMVLPTVQISWA